MEGTKNEFGFEFLTNKAFDPLFHLACSFDGKGADDYVPWVQLFVIDVICASFSPSSNASIGVERGRGAARTRVRSEWRRDGSKRAPSR
jgi:hypothetical protein